LDVPLRRLSPEPGSGIKRAPGEETTSPGTSILRRLGAAPAAPEKSRTTPPVEPAVPPSQPTMPSVAPVELAPLPPDAARPQESPPATPPSAFEALPPLNRSAPEVVDRP